MMVLSAVLRVFYLQRVVTVGQTNIIDSGPRARDFQMIAR